MAHEMEYENNDQESKLIALSRIVNELDSLFGTDLEALKQTEKVKEKDYKSYDMKETPNSMFKKLVQRKKEED